MPRPARRIRRAFSLLELTLVLAIIGVLMAVAAVNLLGTSDRANVRATEATLSTVGAQIDAYAVSNQGSYPPTLQTLVAGGYLRDERSLRDAWKIDLWYSPTADTQGNKYTLFSAGKDKQHGTQDDINYWLVGR